MKKIASIIESCNKCPHLVTAQTNSSSNITNVAICGFYSEDIETEPSLLLYSKHESIKHFSLDIPENCPLENYLEK